ncbi:MAG: TIGR00341 family protein [Gammaproteobacteria bacterium]|nr:TIGR00341 family protein [Gammaproteobacteria bacterium]
MKVIEVIADFGHLDTIKGVGEQYEIPEIWHSAVDESGRCSIRMLVQPEIRQRVMDTLQSILSGSEDCRIILYDTEAIWPLLQKNDSTQKKPVGPFTVTREELYSQIEQGAHLNGTYLLLVILSTIVVAIGLIEDNVAVVIGAMVIAPLLGPNLALALGSALGDRELMTRALNTILVGIGLSFFLCWLLGISWATNLESKELLARTYVGIDGVVLALASGLAAALSLTTGLSSVLVGVMVAVALLPPVATAGIMMGAGQYDLAGGAGLLLAVNIVCINLSAKIVFLLKGVRPRTWIEKKNARQSYVLFMLVWLVSLAILTVIIYSGFK